MAVVILLLAACHWYYVSASRIPPSTDEAHYMSGALSVAEGLRSGTLSGAWSGYRNALGFKAPLVCLPAALVMLITGGLTFPAYFSLVLTFVALGFASYWMFRRFLEPFQSGIAVTLLLTTPLVTGLTHRFYVELLLALLVVVYSGLLMIEPWSSPKLSLALGAVFGLGLLCKSSFPGLIVVPTLYSLSIAVRYARLVRLAGNLIAAGIAAIVVAGPWYAYNWQAVLHHGQLALTATDLYYPHWIQVYVSATAWIVVVCFAVAGLARIANAFLKGSVDTARKRAWIILLLTGFSTVFLTAVANNKMTRFTVTALPMVVCLAVAALPDPAKSKSSRYGLSALAGVSALLSLHLSFGILPITPVRIGDVRIVDTHFPLNIPDWYEDNHPVDRRNFRLEEAEALIARDARAHPTPGHTAEARTTILSLLLDHDYFQVLAAVNQSPVRYTWWPGSVTAGPQAPDYILGFDGFDRVYPGREFHNHYSNLQTDVAERKVPYRVLSHLEGPSETGIWIYVKNREQAE